MPEKKDKPHSPSAKQFIAELKTFQSDAELKKIQRYFKTGEGEYGAGDRFMGVKMGQLFALAKKYSEMPVSEIEKLLESDTHEARAGAVSILDKASRNKKTTEQRRKEFFDLYMKRHDRINNWDLVDLGCLHMTGNYAIIPSAWSLHAYPKILRVALGLCPLRNAASNRLLCV